jgi:C-terminal processing protease CtpA/Prc
VQQAEISEIVAQTGQLVVEYYVFPDIGERLGEILAARLADGRYAQADGPAALAGLVTEDLQSVNGDRHLRLKHHATEVPDLPSEGMMVEMFAQQAARSMGGVARVERLAGNVGVLDLSPILFSPSMSADAHIAAMQLVARTDVLIIDLRRNHGGDPETVALICSYLFDERTHLTNVYERAGDRTQQFWTLPYVPGPRFGGTKPIYVLTSRATFSGGEELAYDLQQLGRATIVGEPTGGGAHPRMGFRVHPHLEATVPSGRAINPLSGTNWEGHGVRPDVEVPADDAFITAYRRALEDVRRLSPDSLQAAEAEQAHANLTVAATASPEAG